MDKDSEKEFLSLKKTADDCIERELALVKARAKEYSHAFKLKEKEQEIQQSIIKIDYFVAGLCLGLILGVFIIAGGYWLIEVLTN
jgi:F0F1-type ATP synthase assembly protein I